MKGRWGDGALAGARPGFLPGGAALVSDDGADAWVLAEDQPHRGLGPALAWASRHAPGAERVHVVAAGGPDVAGVLARRAEWFDGAVHVYGIEGTAPVDARPAPLPGPRPADPQAEALRPMIERAGAEYLVEGGLVRAEVKGLEVARVEVRDGDARLAVGVGKHDREARLDLRGTSQGQAELADAVRTVSDHRREGGAGHPAYHLAPERWLRWVLLRRPQLAGARELDAVPSPVDRRDLRQPAPAPAAGTGVGGEALLVVCSVGVDVDLVPVAVDAWLADGRRPRLVVCVPEGDDHRVTRDLTAALAFPAEVATVGPGWRSW